MQCNTLCIWGLVNQRLNVLGLPVCMLAGLLVAKASKDEGQHVRVDSTCTFQGPGSLTRHDSRWGSPLAASVASEDAGASVQPPDDAGLTSSLLDITRPARLCSAV